MSLNKYISGAALLLLFSLGVYAGLECVDHVAGKACLPREAGGEGAGADCVRHYIPSFLCLSGDYDCVGNENPDIKVTVTVKKGKCMAKSGGLYCGGQEIDSTYAYPRGCFTVH
jgi:hypothetical protein